jgi:hypothetical protein
LGLILLILSLPSLIIQSSLSFWFEQLSENRPPFEISGLKSGHSVCSALELMVRWHARFTKSLAIATSSLSLRLLSDAHFKRVLALALNAHYYDIWYGRPLNSRPARLIA